VLHGVSCGVSIKRVLISRYFTPALGYIRRISVYQYTSISVYLFNSISVYLYISISLYLYTYIGIL
jgi:hypothetical protein